MLCGSSPQSWLHLSLFLTLALESAPIPPSSNSLTPSACHHSRQEPSRAGDDKNRRPPLGLRPVLQPVLQLTFSHMGAESASARKASPKLPFGPTSGSIWPRAGRSRQSKRHSRQRRFLSMLLGVEPILGGCSVRRMTIWVAAFWSKHQLRLLAAKLRRRPFGDWKTPHPGWQFVPSDRASHRLFHWYFHRRHL